jgi:hypothetical protein
VWCLSHDQIFRAIFGSSTVWNITDILGYFKKGISQNKTISQQNLESVQASDTNIQQLAAISCLEYEIPGILAF